MKKGVLQKKRPEQEGLMLPLTPVHVRAMHHCRARPPPQLTPGPHPTSHLAGSAAGTCTVVLPTYTLTKAPSLPLCAWNLIMNCPVSSILVHANLRVYNWFHCLGLEFALLPLLGNVHPLPIPTVARFCIFCFSVFYLLVTCLSCYLLLSSTFPLSHQCSPCFCHARWQGSKVWFFF